MKFIWIVINNHMFLFFKFYNKKRSYDPIDYVCFVETEFWIIDEDESGELNLEEMENRLYEEGSLPREVEGSSSATQIGLKNLLNLYILNYCYFTLKMISY